MSQRLALAVWTPDDLKMPVDQYLAGIRGGELDWLADPDSSAMFLESMGREWLSRWNLGALERLVPQLADARQRLARHRDAIVRSAVDDQPTVPYLLFEPSADDVAVTLFFIEDVGLGAVYPLPGEPDDAEALYDYVRERRSELVSALPELMRAEAFESVPLAYDLTLDSLERESALGRELLSLLGLAP